MTWEKGRYFTRSQKIAGKVERIYYGNSADAHKIALLFDRKRIEKQRIRNELARIRAFWSEIEHFLDVFDDLTKALMDTVCAEAGFHNHHGQWRKRRVNCPNNNSNTHYCRDQRTDSRDQKQRAGRAVKAVPLASRFHDGGSTRRQPSPFDRT